jgi:5-methylcytosine-specific restriction protein B
MAERTDWTHPSKYPSMDRAAVLPGAGVPPAQSLQDAIASADRAEISARAAAGERERLEVIRRFPLDGWPSMPLERYALGTANSADSFCRWMEFNTPNLPSMKGGSALKHMIFRRRGADAGWYYERKYQSADEAWEHVRAGFVDAFRRRRAALKRSGI